jgi:hypothetical protein
MLEERLTKLDARKNYLIAEEGARCGLFLTMGGACWSLPVEGNFMDAVVRQLQRRDTAVRYPTPQPMILAKEEPRDDHHHYRL